MNKWIRGTNAAVVSVAVIGIFIVLTIFLNAAKGMQIDMTSDQKYSLSPQTIEALGKLEENIRIIVLTSPSTDPYVTQEVIDIAKVYQKYSNKITFEEYDVVKNPAIAREYDVEPEGTLVVQQGEKKNTVYFYDMFLVGQRPGEYHFSGEEKLTQAIVNFSNTEKRKAYLLQGHQEFPLSAMSMWKSGMERVNYELEELNLLQTGQIPDDAEALFIISPQLDISDAEAQVIKEFLEKDGKLYFAFGFNPDMGEGWKNINSLLSGYGIVNQKAIALQPSQSILNDPLTIIPSYGWHDITMKMQEYKLLTVMTLAVSMTTDPAHTAHKADPLLKTSEQAYGETDLMLLQEGKSAKEDGDVAGPLNLAYAVESTEGTPKAIVLGGATFLRDDYITVQGNRDFALNTVNWLFEDEEQITIRPRTNEPYPTAAVTESQASMIWYGTMIFFPLLILIIGGVIWWRRSRG